MGIYELIYFLIRHFFSNKRRRRTSPMQIAQVRQLRHAGASRPAMLQSERLLPVPRTVGCKELCQFLLSVERRRHTLHRRLEKQVRNSSSKLKIRLDIADFLENRLDGGNFHTMSKHGFQQMQQSTLNREFVSDNKRKREAHVRILLKPKLCTARIV